MTTTTVDYYSTGDDFHPVPETPPPAEAYSWGSVPWETKWAGDLAIAFPFYKVQWDLYYAAGGSDAADDWAWKSGLIATSNRLMRCGLTRVLAGQCNVRVQRVTEIYTSPVDVVAEVIQSVAPFLAWIPGIGTIAAAALSAAASLALGDPIDKALIGVTAAALPTGGLRETFLAASDFTVNPINGERIDRAALHSTREMIGAVGGDRGRTAFDAGLAAARGERIDDAALTLARDHVVATLGFEGAVAFDTAVGIAQNQSAPEILRQLTRDYVVQAGGQTLAALYDAGFALAEGEALQDAGFKFLSTLAKGNDLAEKAASFGKNLARAIESGKPIKEILTRDILKELAPLGLLGRGRDLNGAISKLLGDAELLSRWPVQIAEALNVNEVVAWAAQAAIVQLEDGSRVVDPQVMALLQEYELPTTTSLRLAATYYVRDFAPPKIATRVDTTDRYRVYTRDFAQPKQAAVVVDTIRREASQGDAEAQLAKEALDRAARTLARQPWIDYYNGL